MNESQSYHQIGAIFPFEVGTTRIVCCREFPGPVENTPVVCLLGGEILIIRQECVSLIFFWGEINSQFPKHKPQVL